MKTARYVGTVRASLLTLGASKCSALWKRPKTYLGEVVSTAVEGSGRRCNVRLERQGDDGLQYGDEHKGPCPFGVGDVHPGRAADGWWQGGGEAFALVVSARRGGKGRLAGWVVVGVGSKVAVERLTSQEGCARLVARNFGKGVSRRWRLGHGDIKSVLGEAW